MKVAFLHVKQDPVYALLMIESVKRHMPWAPLVQFTDDDDPELPGCRARRLPWDGKYAMEFRLQHMSRLDGDVLLLDTDVILQQNVTPIFSLPFDIALTRRDGPIFDPEGNDLTKIMPYNAGVSFSRCREFWQTCYDWVMQQNDRVRNWYGDQLAMTQFAKGFNLLTLHCDNFNYTPLRADEDVSDRYIVHLKGDRKKWMPQFASMAA